MSSPSCPGRLPGEPQPTAPQASSQPSYLPFLCHSGAGPSQPCDVNHPKHGHCATLPPHPDTDVTFKVNLTHRGVSKITHVLIQMAQKTCRLTPDTCPTPSHSRAARGSRHLHSSLSHSELRAESAPLIFSLPPKDALTSLTPHRELEPPRYSRGSWLVLSKEKQRS